MSLRADLGIPRLQRSKIKTSSLHERKVIDALLQEGYEILKSGWPDLVAVRGPEIRFIEIKRPSEPGLKTNQIRMARILYSLGIVVEVMRGPLAVTEPLVQLRSRLKAALKSGCLCGHLHHFRKWGPCSLARRKNPGCSCRSFAPREALSLPIRAPAHFTSRTPPTRDGLNPFAGPARQDPRGEEGTPTNGKTPEPPGSDSRL